MRTNALLRYNPYVEFVVFHQQSAVKHLQTLNRLSVSLNLGKTYIFYKKGCKK